MAPREEPSEHEAEEREKFMKELAEYHEKRGTVLEEHPKVGPRVIDLYKLYHRVLLEGGYDKCSDTKGNKLAWRRIASEFLPHNAHIVQLAFQVKTVFYKYLAAYEISTFHKKEPPPKEILEDLTAKGGDLLNRTLENYERRAPREVDKLGNGMDSDDSDHENGTPRGDKMDLDDPNSTGRVTRGLRAAPAQRVLFGSATELTPSRQTRAGAANSPTPAQLNGIHGSSAIASVIANYTPRSNTIPATVNPVTTPANNPAFYHDLARKQRAMLRRNRTVPTVKGMMIPGIGFTGPGIYVRCTRALESGIDSEIKYALHHLVKISFERGDKFMFVQFPSLADELMRVICRVSEAWYDQHPGWSYTWSSEEASSPNTLCELTGTPGLLEKINQYNLLPDQTLRSPEFRDIMDNASQACLILRNMAILDDNAKFLCELPLIRDVMTIVFQLPRRAETIELKSSALDIAESLVRWWSLPHNDSFYMSLLDVLEQCAEDRGMIIAGLRALSKISFFLEAINRLDNVPVDLLKRIAMWLLVEDEEIRTACLDFLYQYTAVTENVNYLVKHLDMDNIIEVLMTFLARGALPVRKDAPAPHYQPHPEQASKAPSPSDTIPKLAPSIIAKLAHLNDAREQSSAWLRSCFVEHEDGEITQLALWSAYNECMKELPEKNLMAAKDFITNVTTVFPNAQARVVPQEGGSPKYTMKGISPRAVPIDLHNRPLSHCKWRNPVAQSTEVPAVTNGSDSLFKECDMWFPADNAQELWNHIVEKHLEIPKDPANPSRFKESLIKDPSRKFVCLWKGCTRYPSPGHDSGHEVADHIKSHIPDSSAREKRARVEAELDLAAKRQRLDHTFLNTPIDESGPFGLAVSAILVLRNLARQFLKIEAADMRGNQHLVEKYFALHHDRIVQVAAFNYSLKAYSPELLMFLSKGLPRPAGSKMPQQGD